MGCSQRQRCPPVRLVYSNWKTPRVGQLSHRTERIAYYVELTITFPYTKADFDTDKQTKYKNAVAMASGTVPDNVEIVSITEAHGSVKVETIVRVSDKKGFTALNEELGTGDARKDKLSTAIKAMGLAEATSFTQEEWSIGWGDIVITILTIFSEFYVSFGICAFSKICCCRESEDDQFNPGPDGKCTKCDKTEGDHSRRDRREPGRFPGEHVESTNLYCPDYPHSNIERRCWRLRTLWCFTTFVSFPITTGCSIGKLFPPRFPSGGLGGSGENIGYPGCSSVRCEKLVHNAVMTLACVPFDLMDSFNLHHQALETPISTRRNLCAKIFEVGLSLGYLLYDTLKQDPGVARVDYATALVVVAFVCGLLSIGCESYTLYSTCGKKIQRHDTVTGPNTV
jgi:hypothetical protein